MERKRSWQLRKSLNIPLDKMVVPSDRLVSGWVERHQQPSIYIYTYVVYVLYTYRMYYTLHTIYCIVL